MSKSLSEEAWAMRYAVLSLAFVCFAAAAVGDVVHLNNGGSIEGQVTETKDGVILKLPAGEMRISADAIDRIEQKPSALDAYQKRLKNLDADDADAQYQLGLWARARGLKRRAEDHFEKAIAINPDHEGARKALGYRLVNGKWLSEDEEMRARGLVQYDDQWMTPEAAAKLKALQAELAVAREKRIAAEAELEKARRQAQQQPQPQPPEDFPVYGNPYDQYYSTRHLRSSRTYYWAPPYRTPYYTGPYSTWWFYPGGIRSRRRYHTWHVR